MKPSGSEPGARRRRRLSVREEDLEELYLLVQGAPYANTVLDAKASLAQQDLEGALRLIEASEARFRQSNRRILRQDVDLSDDQPRSVLQQARRVKQKQDRCKHVLAAFEEVMSSLRRMIRLRGGGKQAVDDSGPRKLTTQELLRGGSRFRMQYETARSTRLQLAAIQRYFVVREVASIKDLVADALYFYRGKERTYLIVLQDANPQVDHLPLRMALSDQQMKPVERTRLLDMGRRRTLLRLVPRGETDPDDESAARWLWEGVSEDVRRNAPQAAEILDRGTFSQLHDAAVRSGLVASVDAITHVRDREFRLGEYQKAFEVIERLYGKFSAAATQREQRLRREDVDLASGKVRMSPKELLEKRARDTAETQRVDRARNRFLRVLEGLRVLMRSAT